MATVVLSMKAEGFLERLSGITVWKRAGERAPHKPLLLLMAMGGAVRGEDRLVRYSEIDNALTGLLKHFGPPRQVQHPEFPFGRLVRDGLWEIPEEASLRRTRSGDLLRAELIARGITGGLPEPLYRLLTDNLRTVQLAAGRILGRPLPNIDAPAHLGGCRIGRPCGRRDDESAVEKGSALQERGIGRVRA